MDIKSRFENLIEWGIRNQNNLLVCSVLILGFLIGLGFDRLVNLNRVAPIIIDKNAKIGPSVIQENLPPTVNERVSDKSDRYVASINGNAYYPANCKAAEKIKEENKIWFKSAAEAEIQGYKPAQNCR